MIGPLELLIVVLIVLVVFGGYRALPRLGRSAGRGARVGGQKAGELAAKASERIERVDTDRIARSAGEAVREARETRDAFSGSKQPGDERREDEPETGRPAPAAEDRPADRG